METTTSSLIQPGAAIRYGWNSVKANFWYFVGIAFIAGVVGGIGSDKGWSLWDVVGFMLTALVTCGSTTIILHFHANGQKLPLSTLFTTTKQYWQVLGAMLLLGVIVSAGFILLVIPGVILALMYQFTITIMIDKKLGITDAMKASAALTRGYRLSLLGFDLVMLGVIILGALALGVGVLVAIPVTMLANIYLYRKLSGVTPPVTPNSAPVS